MVTQQRSRRRPKLGREADDERLGEMARWAWRWMHMTRAARQRLDVKDPQADWVRGYYTGVATATKIVLRDVLRTRRALREQAGREEQ